MRKNIPFFSLNLILALAVIDLFFDIQISAAAAWK
jgi:hypothetical protein